MKMCKRSGKILKASQKVFCACKPRSEKNVPAEKCNSIDSHSRCVGFCACEWYSPLTQSNEPQETGSLGACSQNNYLSLQPLECSLSAEK